MKTLHTVTITENQANRIIAHLREIAVLYRLEAGKHTNDDSFLARAWESEAADAEALVNLLLTK